MSNQVNESVKVHTVFHEESCFEVMTPPAN